MDFGNRISEAQGSANTSKNSYNEYAQQAGQAGTKFNDAFDNRQSFDDVFQGNLDKYYNNAEVTGARDSYQNARAAVDQLNTTINKMPESIRQQYGGTGLTEAQRQRALTDQYSQNANTYNMLNTNYQNMASNYNDLAGRGMQMAQYGTSTALDEQSNALGMLQGAWNTLLGQRNTAYGQNQTDRGLLAEQYGARDTHNYQQQQLELERWKEQQANARAAADRQAQMNLEKYLQDRSDSAAAAQNQLQQQLMTRQSKADYNKYVTGYKQDASDKANKGMADWWSRMWDNNGHQNRVNNDYNNAIKSMLSYDQYVGNM